MALHVASLEPLTDTITLCEIKKDGHAHLSDIESAILKRQTEEHSPTKVTYFSLFRHATRADVAIISIGSLCSIVGGATTPIMNLIIASIAGSFSKYYQGQTTNFASEMSRLTLYLVYLAIGQLFTISIAVLAFTYTGEKITGRMRFQYLANLLRQNVGYFDTIGAGEITTRITNDVNMVQDGISEKVAMSLKGLSTFVAAYVVGFVVDWRLTLVLTSTVVAIAGTLNGLSQFVVRWSKNALACYAEGGSLAEEVLSPGSIRNVLGFGIQDKLAQQYDELLATAEWFGFKMKSVVAIMAGFLMFCIYSTYALAFWIGSRYLIRGQSTLSDILTVLLSIMGGAFALGHVGPNIQSFMVATSAASKIYSTIDRPSALDPTSTEGLNICSHALQGAIELRDIKHVYPSRPDVVVFENLKIIFPPGKTTAIVGPSGSGKSTIVGLLQRLYMPVAGQILLDGLDIRDINLRWLRQQIGLVSQEPSLFDTTIAENIRFGIPDFEPFAEDAMELIHNAAKICGADDFIRHLPNGYHTQVKDTLLSGGQKQRIAIARAIVGNPKILLLDEATSALDNRSEQAVQTALEKAAKGRTTIVVAHRLSTIRDADNIIVMEKGCVVEQGNHDQLLQRRGVYHKLIEAQIQDSTDCSRTSDFGLSSFEVSNEQAESIAKKPLSRFSAESTRTLYPAGSTLPRQSSPWFLIKFVASLNKPEWHVMLTGLISSFFCGAGNPLQAIFFAKCITALSLPPSRHDETRSLIDFWTGLFFMLAIVELFFHLSQGVSFAWCSEKLVRRARDTAFRSMLGQDVTYFEENSVGSLTSFLSTETTHLAGISGITLGTILNAVSTLCIGCVIALAIGWKLALVCIATIPIVVGCGFLRFWIMSQLHASAMKACSASAAYACEVISAIRTVASLTLEAEITRRYYEQLTKQSRTLKSMIWTSALYGASEACMTLCVALGFWFGGKMIGEGEYTIFQFYAAFMAIINGSEAAGTVFSFAPDMGKSKYAATQLMALFERKPAIEGPGGEPVRNMTGQIEFRNVHFRYPSRDEMILRGLALNAEPGQFVALVGSSGSGKSTIISLLERFYDPLAGQIFVDGKDISTLNIGAYRSHIALVSQEPRLYQGTIRDQIVMGTDEAQVTEKAIAKVCREANIYDFIASLPHGFDTDVGNKAVMLSGGQKQRIAIARALLRNPRILLLDEATSAIDAVSERAVQAAIDEASKGRTTIAIAHRLSTIQKADMIYVLDQGRVAEYGTHLELMARGGKYFDLVWSQTRQIQ